MRAKLERIAAGKIEFDRPVVTLSDSVVTLSCRPGEKAEGVSIEGLYYPLQNAVLTSGFPLGVSNQFTGVSARVSVRKGTLLAMWQEAPASLLERL